MTTIEIVGFSETVALELEQELAQHRIVCVDGWSRDDPSSYSADEDLLHRRKRAPDVILLSWAGWRDGLRLDARIHPPDLDDLRGGLAIPILALVDSGPEADEARMAGAAGALSSRHSDDELAAAIAAIAAGLVISDPYLEMTDRVAAPAAAGAGAEEQADDAEAPPEPLTARERQVLALVSAGRSNREIGAELFISENTVKYHISGILGKLDARTRTEAAMRGARLGLV